MELLAKLEFITSNRSFSWLGFAGSYYLVNSTTIKDLGFNRVMKQVDLVPNWARGPVASLSAPSQDLGHCGRAWETRLGPSEMRVCHLHCQHQGLDQDICNEVRSEEDLDYKTALCNSLKTQFVSMNHWKTVKPQTRENVTSFQPWILNLGSMVGLQVAHECPEGQGSHWEDICLCACFSSFTETAENG